MSRWLPIPLDAASSPALAGVSPSARLTWLALRVAHARYGVGGVLPAAHATASGLPLAAPAMVAGVDVAAGLAELRAAGLMRPHDDGVALADWSVDAEQAHCSSCRRRNPDPRHARCPACRSRDTDPTRRAARRKGGAEMAQTSRSRFDGTGDRSQQRIAASPAPMAQTDRGDGADMPRPRPDPTRPDPTVPESPDARAGARETPAAPAGDPIHQHQQRTAAAPRGDPIQRGQRSLDVRALASAWAVDMAGRGIERMLPAIHAADVVRLLAEVGTDPPHVHDVDGLARDRRAAAQRIMVWCPSPERLARWCVVAARRYRAENVAAYLRRAADCGDPGTLLARHAQGDHALGRDAERALRGEHAEDVARLVAGGSAMRDAAATDADRDRLRQQLADLLRRGLRDGARRTLLQLLGDDRSDLAIARAVAGVCGLAAARRLIA